MEATSPGAARPASGPTENRRSTVAEHVPATALVAAMSNDLGDDAQADARRCTAATRRSSRSCDQVDQALGPDRWGRRGASAGSATARSSSALRTGRPRAASIIVPTDKAAADHLFTALRSFIALGGAQQGITVRDEAYNGTTITVIDLGDASKLAGMAGAAGVTGVPAAPTGHVEIAYAVTDERRRHRLGAGLRQARPRHDQGHVARVERPLHEPGRPGRHGDGLDVRRHHRHPRPHREGRCRLRRRPGRDRQVPDRRQAVPRSVRRALRVELDRERPEPLGHHSPSSSEAHPAPRPPQEEDHHSWQSASG